MDKMVDCITFNFNNGYKKESCRGEKRQKGIFQGYNEIESTDLFMSWS